MKRLVQVLLSSAAMALASCATPGFDRAWKQSMAAPIPKNDVTGPWTGEWISAANGHSGQLRCLVERKDEDTLSFRYWATWAGWMKASFRMEGDVKRRPDGRYDLEGTKKMFPWGTYAQEGVLAPDRLQSSFRSERSNLGTFQLERPERPAEAGR